MTALQAQPYPHILPTCEAKIGGNQHHASLLHTDHATAPPASTSGLDLTGDSTLGGFFENASGVHLHSLRRTRIPLLISPCTGMKPR